MWNLKVVVDGGELTLESRIIGGLDIVIIINNRGWNNKGGWLDGVEKIV